MFDTLKLGHHINNQPWELNNVPSFLFIATHQCSSKHLKNLHSKVKTDSAKHPLKQFLYGIRKNQLLSLNFFSVQLQYRLVPHLAKTESNKPRVCGPLKLAFNPIAHHKIELSCLRPVFSRSLQIAFYKLFSLTEGNQNFNHCITIMSSFFIAKNRWLDKYFDTPSYIEV